MTEQLELNPEAEPGTQPVAAAPPSLASVVSRIAHALEGTLSPGEVADLRRLRPGEPGSPAFWKVATHFLEAQLPPSGEARDLAERRWAAIVQGLATLGHLLQPSRSLGRALAEARFSELRFVRLLRAQGDGLFKAVEITAKFLAAKGRSADWTGMARLVLSEGRPDEEKTRRQVAREYFRHLSA